MAPRNIQFPRKNWIIFLPFAFAFILSLLRKWGQKYLPAWFVGGWPLAGLDNRKTPTDMLMEGWSTPWSHGFSLLFLCVPQKLEWPSTTHAGGWFPFRRSPLGREGRFGLVWTFTDTAKVWCDLKITATQLLYATSFRVPVQNNE